MSLPGPYVDFDEGGVVAQSLVRAVGVVAGGFLVLIVFQSLFFALAGIESAAQLRQAPTLWAAASALPGLSFGVAAVAYVRARDESLFEVGVPTPRQVGIVVVGFLALVVVNQLMQGVLSVLSTLLSELFGVTVDAGQSSVVTTLQANPWVVALAIPVTILFVAPGEELLFRGVVQGLLRRSTGTVPAIVGAGLLFGSIHLVSIESGDGWTYVLVATVLGIVLGTLYEYTENLVVPIAVHGLWNSALFLLIYSQATGASLPV